MSVQVKETPGVVLISGISSQESALQICEQFNNWGVKATIGTDTSVSGYQVSAYRVSVDRVKAVLTQLGIEA